MAGNDDRAERLVMIFHDTMKTFHRMGSKAMHSPDLSVQQFQALAVMSTQPFWTLKEVAKSLKIKSPAASELIEKLVKSGWILREINPEDRRETKLKLSARGHSFLNRHRKMMISSFTDFLNRLTPRQQKTFEQSVINLSKIAQILHRWEQQQ